MFEEAVKIAEEVKRKVALEPVLRNEFRDRWEIYVADKIATEVIDEQNPPMYLGGVLSALSAKPVYTPIWMCGILIFIALVSLGTGFVGAYTLLYVIITVRFYINDCAISQ